MGSHPGGEDVAFRATAASLILVVGLVLGLAGSAVGAPQSADAYALGPGDTIEITVVGDHDLSRTVTIKPDGSIDLPLVGEVIAARKTTSQLSAELIKRYSKYLKAPSITVSVHDFRVDHIYVLGQVNKPGEYPVRHGAGMLELLASAGGPTNRADLGKATIIRGNTDTIQLDIFASLAKSQNPEVKLQSGDVIFVPETDRRIVVLGQVARPGAYDLLEGQRVGDLLAAAGGVTAHAAPQRAFIVRGGEQIPVDVQKILAGDLEANVPLMAGDMMVIPESKDRIAVLGAVNKPGNYDLVEGMKLADAIAQAGGNTTAGNLSQVGVIRLEGGKTKSVAVDLSRALGGQDMSQNIPLRPGDVVFVPERGVTLEKAAQFFGIISVVRFLFGAF
jgi:polysaccharide export outer membrane protein